MDNVESGYLKKPPNPLFKVELEVFEKAGVIAGRIHSRRCRETQA
ncbi:hypothetical protein [Paenibacillus abyssi]|nr:hypothetical protein [Paenibacillus abyssi]